MRKLNLTTITAFIFLAAAGCSSGSHGARPARQSESREQLIAELQQLKNQYGANTSGLMNDPRTRDIVTQLRKAPAAR